MIMRARVAASSCRTRFSSFAFNAFLVIGISLCTDALWKRNGMQRSGKERLCSIRLYTLAFLHLQACSSAHALLIQHTGRHQRCRGISFTAAEALHAFFFFFRPTLPLRTAFIHVCVWQCTLGDLRAAECVWERARKRAPLCWNTCFLWWIITRYCE